MTHKDHDTVQIARTHTTLLRVYIVTHRQWQFRHCGKWTMTQFSKPTSFQHHTHPASSSPFLSEYLLPSWTLQWGTFAVRSTVLFSSLPSTHPVCDSKLGGSLHQAVPQLQRPHSLRTFLQDHGKGTAAPMTKRPVHARVCVCPHKKALVVMCQMVEPQTMNLMAGHATN